MAIFDLSGKREQIDVSPMTNSCNTQNTSLTTASAEISRVGFDHMWCLRGTKEDYHRGDPLSRWHAFPRGISRFSSSNPLRCSVAFSLFRSLSLVFPLSRVPILLYGRYVIIEMSSCRCFDNPITRAFAQPVCNATLRSPEISETVVAHRDFIRHAILDGFSRFVTLRVRKYGQV